MDKINENEIKIKWLLDLITPKSIKQQISLSQKNTDIIYTC